ncbi:MAG: hypothetical protein AAGA95_15555, partial [Pseudomonadota bacterium]
DFGGEDVVRIKDDTWVEQPSSTPILAENDAANGGGAFFGIADDNTATQGEVDNHNKIGAPLGSWMVTPALPPPAVSRLGFASMAWSTSAARTPRRRFRKSASQAPS